MDLLVENMKTLFVLFQDISNIGLFKKSANNLAFIDRQDSQLSFWFNIFVITPAVVTSFLFFQWHQLWVTKYSSLYWPSRKTYPSQEEHVETLRKIKEDTEDMKLSYLKEMKDMEHETDIRLHNHARKLNIPSSYLYGGSAVIKDVIETVKIKPR